MKIYTRYFALSLLMFSSALCHAALQNGKLEVSIIKGQSSLINPQSIKEPVVKGKVFEQGYKVETTKDSTVELSLSNGSTILVNPETLVEVRTFRQVASNLIIEGAYQKLDKEPSPSVVEVFVVKGKIIGEVRKLNPQSSFTIKSPAGVARIRGTVYSVEYSRNETTRTGNMEVACVKGSVEVTINGSDSGPQAVEPGKKMNAQTPLVDDATGLISAVPVKVTIPVALVNSPQVSLPSTEGLVVGGEIKAPGVPSGVKVVSIVDGQITFSEPITLAAGTEVVIEPPLGATYEPSKEKEKKTTVIEPTVGKNTIKMASTSGLSPGMKIRAEGVPEDVTVVSVDSVAGTVTLSVPVTVSAGTQVSAVAEKEKKTTTTEPTVGKNTIKMANTSGLTPGMKIRAEGFPEDVTVVSVDSVTGIVTLSAPVTVKVGTEVSAVVDSPPPPPITNPVITFSKLGQEEVKTIANDLSKGTSLPTELKELVNNIADKTPPLVPTTPKDGTTPDKTTTTEKTDTPTETTTTSPTTPGGSTGGVSAVMDAINKTIQETIEKENQKNPSPTQ